MADCRVIDHFTGVYSIFLGNAIGFRRVVDVSCTFSDSFDLVDLAQKRFNRTNSKKVADGRKQHRRQDHCLFAHCYGIGYPAFTLIRHY